MNNLNAFLNPVLPEKIKVIVSGRFKDEQGKPIEWELCPMTTAELEQIRKGCTKRMQVPGKRGQYENIIDNEAVTRKMAAKCVVYPDLHNAELQKRYSAGSADELLVTMLLPGEFSRLMETLDDKLGNMQMDDLVDEAKN